MLQSPKWSVGLRAETIGRDGLSSILPAWEDLCARAAEDNVYYSPRYAQALIAHIDHRSSMSFTLVWHGARLVALMPVTEPAFHLPLLQPCGKAWRTLCTYNCTPLLDRGMIDEAATALIDALAARSSGEWFIPAVNVHGDTSVAITRALQRRNSPWVFLDKFERAVLTPGTSFESYLANTLSPSRRRSLEQRKRRLTKLGEVRHEKFEAGEGLSSAVSAFLEIERNGWKGRMGTALACHPATRKFAAEAFTGDERTSICRADVLSVDGKPVAVSLITSAGRTGFAVKSCYDEAYRRYAPGLLLEIEIVRSFLSDAWVDRLDAATAGAHVLDSLWPEKTAVGDLAFSLAGSGARARLRAFAHSQRCKTAVRRTVKNVVGRPLMRLARMGLLAPQMCTPLLPVASSL